MLEFLIDIFLEFDISEVAFSIRRYRARFCSA
jgi:hypothetical protein